VHRGVSTSGLSKMLGVDPAVLKDPVSREELKGHFFIEKGFFSSSGSPDEAFNGVKLHTFVPQGSKGMYVDPISFNKGEHEFLLQRNTRFRIHDFRSDDNGKLTDLMISVIEQIIDQ